MADTTCPAAAERPEWRGAAAPFPPGSTRIEIEGLGAPIVLVDADPLAEGLRLVLKGRRITSSPMDGTEAPDRTLAVALGTPAGFTIHSRHLDEPMTGLRQASAVCGLIADLAESHYAGRPGWIALHCGAIRAGGRVALVTGPTRAGKSTLIGRLSAEPGIETVCDDVLPVAPDNTAYALGIAPRLRLPLPAAAGAVLRDHVQRHRVLSDRKYAYIMPPSLVPFGAAGRVSTVIVLDRRDTAVPARLHHLNPAEAVGHLLARQMSDDGLVDQMLARAQGLATAADCLRLVYSGIEDATALIARLLGGATGPHIAEVLPPLSHAGARPQARRTMEALPTGCLRQTSEVTVRRVEDDHFICLPDRRNVVRLNPVGGAIWKMLEVPRTAAEIVDLLATAFPEVDQARIAGDVAELLARLIEAELAEPDDA